MKRIIRLTESDLTRIVRRIINESASPKTISDKLKLKGIPNNKINLLQLQNENTWVLQITTENKNVLSISYPVLVDEIPSKSTTMVTVIIDNKEKNMSFDSAVTTVVNEYNKRKLPTSKRNG
jgi:maltodextrin utilization protein YvdJ